MRFERVLSLAAAIGAACVCSLAGAQPLAAGQDPGKIALAQDPGLARHPSSLLVRFAPGTDARSKANLRSIVAGRSVHSYSTVQGLEQLHVGIDLDAALAILNAAPNVVYAEPDYVLRSTVTPNDTFFNLQWGAENTGQDIRGTLGTVDADIDATEAWDITTGDANFVIAVIDTGTQWNHPDLDGNIWSNPDEIAGNGIDDDGNGYIDDTHGWDFFSNDNNPDDGSGHGSHTAGTVGAEGNNGVGVTGMNWQCKIMPLRFLGPNGGYTSDAIRALDYAVAEGVKVSNNSWGGGGFSTALYNSINAAGAAGHLFVAAAGNSGVNTDGSPHYPSSYDSPNIISVAATDNNDGLASFSNYGSASVDLGAPGVDIASTYSGSNYVWLSGTSMASPHVAGVAALVWAANPAWNYGQVRDALLSTTRPIASLQGKCATGGMLNAYAALTGTPPPPPPPPSDPPATPGDPVLTDQGAGNVLIEWADNSNDEDGFDVQRERKIRGNRFGETTLIGTFSTDVTSATDVPGNGTFRYRVRAFNANGDSSWSGWARISVDDGSGGGGGGGNGNGNGGGRPPR